MEINFTDLKAKLDDIVALITEAINVLKQFIAGFKKKIVIGEGENTTEITL